MKKKYKIAVSCVTQTVFEVDAENERTARVEALLKMRNLASPFYDHGISVHIIPPIMDDFEVSEIPLSSEETDRRQRLDQLLSQANGPVFEIAGVQFKAVSDRSDSDWIALKTGKRKVWFDGGRMWEDHAERAPVYGRNTRSGCSETPDPAGGNQKKENREKAKSEKTKEARIVAGDASVPADSTA